MRISDWSSDVCSSDLSLDEPQRVQRVAVLREEQATREHRGEVFIQRPNIFGREGTRFDAEAFANAPRQIFGCVGCIAFPDVDLAGHFDNARRTRTTEQPFGSESCRERVCNYV